MAHITTNRNRQRELPRRVGRKQHRMDRTRIVLTILGHRFRGTHPIARPYYMVRDIMLSLSDGSDWIACNLGIDHPIGDTPADSDSIDPIDGDDSERTPWDDLDDSE